MSRPSFRNFEDFWPYYLGEHSDPMNRWLHFAGTSGFLALVIGTIFQANPWMVLFWPVAGYGPAWIGHFIVEKNRPATFQHPIWSLMGDFRMYGRMWQGRYWQGVADPA